MRTTLLKGSKVIVKDHIRVVSNTELWFDRETGLYTIRKGFMRANCVVDKLSEQNLRGIYNKIGKILKIPGHKTSRPTKYVRRPQVKPL